MIKISVHTRYIVLCFSLILLGVTGCKKFIEGIDFPIDKVTSESVYSNTGTASAVLSGIYFSMGCGGPGLERLSGDNGISVNFSVTADELKPNTNNQFDFAATILYPNAYIDDPTGLWKVLYGGYIFNVNSAIEGVSASSGIPEVSKQILLGEARFLRAFFYFYLINLYGDVPLVTGTDFTINSKVSRSPKAVVYKQIITDLLVAQQNLSDNYLQPDLVTATVERVRPNKAAATALLARVYLYTGQWQNAEVEATKVITNVNYELADDLTAVFLKNSPETIWALQPNPKGTDSFRVPTANTGDGAYFIPGGSVVVPNASINQTLISSFESGDQRRNIWIKSVTAGGNSYPIPFKYKAGRGNIVQTEFQMVLRLAEQYLIRAEARAQQDKITGVESAKEDLDAIRIRAGLSDATATSKIAMLDAISKERRVELFTEWGDRWFDLKRTGKIDEVMSVVTPLKGGTWEPFKALFAVPLTEIKINPNLLPQNLGYPSTI